MPKPAFRLSQTQAGRLADYIMEAVNNERMDPPTERLMYFANALRFHQLGLDDAARIELQAMAEVRENRGVKCA